MGRTDCTNKTPLDKEGHYAQSWSWLIGATIEIVDFDDKDTNKITNIALKIEDETGKQQRLWLSAHFKPVKYKFSYFSLH
ncbi:hypothetical protein MUO79_11585 [Candidatus Bathyarchaeota archaeon]|nr:hypothetical protein [Candidatus Bathyarchaeota archaeon]